MSKKKVVEIYYEKPVGEKGHYETGMYFVLEDGAVLRQQTTDMIMPYEVTFQVKKEKPCTK